MSHQPRLGGRLCDVFAMYHWVAVILYLLCRVAPLQGSILQGILGTAAITASSWLTSRLM